VVGITILTERAVTASDFYHLIIASPLIHSEDVGGGAGGGVWGQGGSIISSKWQKDLLQMIYILIADTVMWCLLNKDWINIWYQRWNKKTEMNILTFGQY